MALEEYAVVDGYGKRTFKWDTDQFPNLPPGARKVADDAPAEKAAEKPANKRARAPKNKS